MASTHIRQRIVEFLGGSSLEESTSSYITHSDGCRFVPEDIKPPTELDWYLERKLDVARSLHDHDSILLHLDVEYVNFDVPMEAYTNPWRAFDLQEAVVNTIEELLLDHGIRPLHLITGQGHHFVWRISRSSDAAASLAQIHHLPDYMRGYYEKAAETPAMAVDPVIQDSFAGLGLVMEYLAQQIKYKAAPKSQIPVEITAVHVGPTSTSEREMISIDISEYGDPLYTRMIRVPFSAYLKPWVNGMLAAHESVDPIPRFRAIPLHEIDTRLALVIRQDEESMKQLARRSSTHIPEQNKGTEKLIADYLTSDLRKFHEYFYSEEHEIRENWPETYHNTPLHQLQPCARHILEHPNDLLLKPAGIQMVTRCLMAENWHPHHIAGLIRSIFENPSYEWKEDWTIYDPAARADFYVRLFSGMMYTKIDQLIDFNCTSTQEKGFCFDAGCNLESTQKQLLNRLTT